MTKSNDRQAIAQRSADVAMRYLHGETQNTIAAALDVDQATISRDLAAVRKAWLDSAIRDFDAARAIELAKIDEVEREYWLAWERSQKDKEIAYQEQSDKKKVGLRRESQVGNPAFLDGVLRCIEKRCAILGLDAPRRFVIDWDRLTPEQEERLARGEDPAKVLTA